MSKGESVDQFHFAADRGEIIFTVGIFLIAGSTIGLTGALIIDYFSGFGEGIGGAILSVLMLLLVYFVGMLVGPLIGIFSGARIGTKDYTEENMEYVTSVIGSFVGYIVMVLALAIVLGITLGILSNGGGQTGGGSQTSQMPDTGNLLLPLFGFAIPTTIAGATSTWLSSRFSTDTKTMSNGQRETNTPTERSTSVSTQQLETGIGALSERLQQALSHVSYPVGVGFGILSGLAVSFVVSLIVIIDPSTATAAGSFLGLGVDLTEYKLQQTPMAGVRFLSWIVLLAHGIPVENVDLELTRSSFFMLIPGAVLIAGGYLTANYRATSSAVQRMVDGASIMAGYVVLVIFFAFYAPTVPEGFISTAGISVNFIDALLKAGIAYPIVYGGIGGLISYLRSNSTAN